MRCRSCQHELWNIRPGPCPECGEPFSPRTAVFEKYSAHFCCPECGEAYWGNGADGLPDPPDFTCARCSKPVHLDEMVLRPAPGHEGREVRQDLHPFEGSPRPLLRRWWSTVSMALSDPVRLGRALPPAPRLDAAAAFLVIMVAGCGAIVATPMVIQVAYMLITVGSIDVVSYGGSDPLWVAFAVWLAAGVAVPTLVVCATVVVAWLVASAGHREARPPFRRFVACACYASSVAVLSAIPCAGVCAAPLVAVMAARVVLQQLRGAGILTATQARVIYWSGSAVLALATVLFVMWVVSTL